MTTPRNEEMKRLRFDPHYLWTLQMIGDQFHITRQRVHQLLGNTGHSYNHDFHKNRKENRDQRTGRIDRQNHPRK